MLAVQHSSNCPFYHTMLAIFSLAPIIHMPYSNKYFVESTVACYNAMPQMHTSTAVNKTFPLKISINVPLDAL